MRFDDIDTGSFHWRIWNVELSVNIKAARRSGSIVVSRVASGGAPTVQLAPVVLSDPYSPDVIKEAMRHC